MSWFKVDDQLAFNAKVMLSGNSAMGLWVRAGSWSSAQLTGGFIPTHMANAMANAMANPCDADALVMAGLWQEVDGGYQFHDWSDFQPDAELEKQKRKETSEARSAAGKAGARARWAGKSDGKTPDLPKQNDGKPHGKPIANEWQTDAPVPSRPDQTNTEEAKASSVPRKRATRLTDDFTVTPEMRLWAANKAPDADLNTETEKFINYWVAKSGKDATKLDWPATWRNWILNSRSRTQTRPDHSARGLAKGMAMLQAYDAKQSALELEE